MECIAKLISLGCDISKVSIDGFSVMSLAALGECDKKTLEELMELGYNPPEDHIQDLYYQCISLKNNWIFDFLMSNFPSIESISSFDIPKQEKFTILQASIINGLSEEKIQKLLDIPSISKSINNLNALNYGAIHLACLTLASSEDKQQFLKLIGKIFFIFLFFYLFKILFF
jgi:hypothetical protein